MAEKRLTQEEIGARITGAEQLVAVGARYQHYKGNFYTVLHMALLEATNAPCVVYRAEYGAHAIFIRPLEDWLATVETGGKQIPRFARAEITS